MWVAPCCVSKSFTRPVYGVARRKGPMGAPAARQFTASQRLFVRADVAREDLGGDGHVVVSVVDPLDFLVPLGALTRE